MSKSVTPAFLSIDDSLPLNKWRSFEKESKIGGSHIQLRNQQPNPLLHILSQNKSNSGMCSIPAYLLYDKNTWKFYTNLSKPSSSQIHYDNLDEIIGLSTNQRLYKTRLAENHT